VLRSEGSCAVSASHSASRGTSRGEALRVPAAILDDAARGVEGRRDVQMIFEAEH